MNRRSKSATTGMSESPPALSCVQKYRWSNRKRRRSFTRTATWLLCNCPGDALLRAVSHGLDCQTHGSAGQQQRGHVDKRCLATGQLPGVPQVHLRQPGKVRRLRPDSLWVILPTAVRFPSRRTELATALGVNEDAVIVHWHGLQPEMARQILRGDRVPEWWALIVEHVLSSPRGYAFIFLSGTALLKPPARRAD
jgi:hypothetical protein